MRIWQGPNLQIDQCCVAILFESGIFMSLEEKEILYKKEGPQSGTKRVVSYSSFLTPQC